MYKYNERPKKVVQKCVGAQKVYATTSVLEHMTLLFCISASGGSLVPLIILPISKLPELPANVIHTFAFAGSESGCINNNIFNSWLNNTFIPNITDNRIINGANEPALLILDRYSTRKSLDTDKLWADHKIKILLLPTNSSALLQPLDLSVNNKFKDLLRHTFINNPNDNSTERRVKCLICCSQIIQDTLCPCVVRQGWKHSGLYPIDPEIVLSSSMIASEEEIPQKNSQKKKSIKFNNDILFENSREIPIIKKE